MSKIFVRFYAFCAIAHNAPKRTAGSTILPDNNFKLPISLHIDSGSVIPIIIFFLK